MKRRSALGGLVLLCSCGGAGEDLGNRRAVTLPDGAQIQCEVLVRGEDMARGMMFRDSLAADRGMLFVHATPGQYPYWMHNVKIPLDILWLDAGRKIVEMSPDTPSCLKPENECPNYGGQETSQFVVELAGGSIARHKMRVGDVLEW